MPKSSAQTLAPSSKRVSTAKPLKQESTQQASSSALNVRAVDRALDILKAFSVHSHTMSASELLRKVDLSRPTLYRLLKTLENNQFIVSSGEPQRFSLGPAVAQLAHVWSSNLNVADVAEPILKRLWTQSSETVALFQLQGRDRVCISQIQSQHALNYKVGVGYKEVISVGASGRAILAHLDSTHASLKEFNSLFKNKSLNLEDELTLIQQRGYAISQQEVIEGAVAIAAPYFQSDNSVVGSVAIFGPSARIKSEEVTRLTQLVLQAARDISYALGSRRGSHT